MEGKGETCILFILLSAFLMDKLIFVFTFLLCFSFSLAQIGRQLARIGDDVNKEYRRQFEQIANELDMSSETVYEKFSKIVIRYLLILIYFELQLTWGGWVRLRNQKEMSSVIPLTRWCNDEMKYFCY